MHRAIRMLMAVLILFWQVSPAILLANPTGGEVAAGNANISSSGNTLTVTQTSNRAVLNWQGFSISAGELTQFLQPSSNSAIMNRVLGGNPSSIMGTLRANGQVFLINPNGIIVGPSGVIQTQGFVGSTLDVSNDEFMAGGAMNFLGNSGTIQNLGMIDGGEGGVYLIARQIENAGIIDGGAVGLAAGTEVLLKSTSVGEENLFIKAGEVTGGTGIQNSGLIRAKQAELKAAGGNVYALAINNGGVIQATSLTDEGGEIWLRSDGGKIEHSGTIISRKERQDAEEEGGSVQILAQEITLKENSVIDVSGKNGGGTVLIGGDYQGNNPDIPNAEKVTIESGAKILADATETGKGGRVIVWSDNLTQFYGYISALGNVGGFVETSAGQTLVALGKVDAGEWLLDPNNITISGGADTNVTASPDFWSTDDGAVVSVTSIQDALNNGTSVTIRTRSLGGDSELGNITVASSISKTAGADATLTLQAINSIYLNSGINITSSSNKLNITLNADYDSSGAGNIQLLNTNTLTTNGGNIIMGGGANPLTNPAIGIGTASYATRAGVYMLSPQINVGAGNLYIKGQAIGACTAVHGDGIFIQGGTIQSTTGTLSLQGTGSASPSSDVAGGMYLESMTLRSTYGSIVLEGTGGSNTNQAYGLDLYQTTIESTGTGVGAATITLRGTGGSSAAGWGNYGISYYNGTVTSVSGNITIQGTGGDGGYSGRGVNIVANATVTSTGTDANAASITIEGTGSNVNNNNYGVYFNGASTQVTAIDGAISITGLGQGTTDGNYGVDIDAGADVISVNGDIAITGKSTGVGSGNRGVYVLSTSTVQSTGTGADAAKITIIGTGGNGTSNNFGVDITGTAQITSIDGDILLKGTGGSGSAGGNSGVQVYSNATITSTGTTVGEAATITIEGTGGTGTATQRGVNLEGGTTVITSAYGDITITGYGGNGTTWDSQGIFIASGISSTGAGANAAKITLTGTSTDNISSSCGVDVRWDVSSVDGDISITGKGSGADAYSSGIYFYGGGTVKSTGGADITLIGLGSAANEGLSSSAGANIIGNAAMTGNITITADLMALANMSILGQGTLTIQPYTTTTTIGLGTGATGTLNLTDTELGYITTGFSQIYFGRTDSAGDIDIHGNALSTTLGDPVTIRTPASGGDIVFDSTCTNITWSGTNTLEVIAGRTITLNSSALIDSTSVGFSGAQQSIVLRANEGGVATGDNTDAVAINGATIRSSTGDIYIIGQAMGNAASDNYGVYIYNSAQIVSNGTGADAADITIIGTGGSGTTTNAGIYQNSSTITTIDGDVQLTGKGGSGTGNNNYGMGLFGAVSAISSTGTSDTTGTISLVGTGGGGGAGCYGIYSWSNITSAYGDISYTGVGGGTNNQNYGVLLSCARKIESTGTGSGAATITIIGTGGTGDSGGVIMYENSGMTSQVISVDGDIIITGYGAGTDSGINLHYVISNGSADITLSGTSASGIGINSDPDAADTKIGSATMTGNITLSADSMNFLNSTIQGLGTLLIQPTTTTTTIGLGTGATGTLQLSDTELGYITTGFSQIYFGRSDSSGDVDIHGNALATLLGGSPVTVRTPGSAGDIVVDVSANNISWSSAKKFALEAGRTIFVNAGALIENTCAAFGAGNAIEFTANVGGASTGENTDAITIEGTLRSNTGDIYLEGQGKGNGGDYNHGVAIAGSVISTGMGADAAGIIMSGTGGTGNASFGVVATGSGVQVNSVDGNISITGYGGAGVSYDWGINVAYGAQITSSGSGNITMVGTSPGGVIYSEGIGIGGDTDTLISCTNGNISITGMGGAGGTYGAGVYLIAGGKITSVGAGHITIVGTGGNGTNNNYGVCVSSDGLGIAPDNSVQITSVTGDISISGKGDGNGTADYGVCIYDDASVISTGSAKISITGTGSQNGSDNPEGIRIYTNTASTPTIGGAGAAGNITLASDLMYWDQASIQGTGQLLIQPLTTTTTIGLGGGAGTLNLSAAELGYIQNGFSSITIGRSDGTGLITANACTWNDAVTLRSDSITIAGAQTCGANDVTLNIGQTGAAGTLNLNASVSTTGTFAVNGGTSDDNFVFANGVTLPGTLNGAAGTDTLNFSADTTGVSVNLNNYTNIETLTGGSGSDTIIGANAVNTWTLTGASAGTVGGVTFTAFDVLTGGTAADALIGRNTTNTWTLTGANAGTVDGISFSNMETIQGGTGTDTLTGRNVANTWNITGSNAGTISTLAFSQIEAFTGGTSTDSFVFTNGASVSGAINGGAGIDTLDYSAYLTALTINLVTGVATGTDGISNIENVTCGSGNDTVSSKFFSYAQTLIGGAGTDTFNFDACNQSVTSTNSPFQVAGYGTVTFSEFENVALSNASSSSSSTNLYNLSQLLQDIADTMNQGDSPTTTQKVQTMNLAGPKQASDIRYEEENNDELDQENRRYKFWSYLKPWELKYQIEVRPWPGGWITSFHFPPWSPDIPENH
ncbi:MAG: filamentous hemagglutinin N-terminal domain-containing protein [Verrucomicrobiota bacterium]